MQWLCSRTHWLCGRVQWLCGRVWWLCGVARGCVVGCGCCMVGHEVVW